MRSEGELVGRGGGEGGSPLGGEGEGDGVVCEEGRGDLEPLVLTDCGCCGSNLLSLPPLGPAVLEPHLQREARKGKFHFQVLYRNVC